eukprot:scaffold6498_cov23-Cyclotella_meneghiniana.AAC.1
MKSPLLASIVLLSGLTATTAFVPQTKRSLVQQHIHRQPTTTTDTALHASSAKNKKTSRSKWATSRNIHVSSSSNNDNDGGSSKKAPPKLIIAGAPASGKGTQCEIIKEKYGVVHLSTGDMLRAAVADETEVGKLAKDYMDSGKLVPDEVIIGV